MSPADEIDTAQYSVDELEAVVFEAENAGKYVSAHCYSDRSIRNCIQAGVTDTPALRKIPGHERMIEHARKVNPGKRLTTPEDIAAAITLLGLSEQTWLTGNVIRLDGGEDISG